MSKIRAFRGIRPNQGKSELVASLPYDVMNRAEAKEMVSGQPESFLHVVRAEVDLPDTLDAYDPKVYAQGKETLDRFLKQGTLIQDDVPKLYIYRLIMNGRVQTGLVACASVDEYLQGKIKKHELTREAKEQDRIRHFDTCDANTAPIFLTYRQKPSITHEINEYIKFHNPTAQFTTEDDITHITWVIEDQATIQKILKEFESVEALYIADGHHRCASSAKVGQKRRQEHPEAGAEAEFNYFLSVIFPDEDLFIMDYNRVVKDLNGLSAKDFLEKVGQQFTVRAVKPEEAPYRPMEKGHFGLFLDGQWYELAIHPELMNSSDPVERLDVQLLQKYLLHPILGIEDPRTDERIDFVGGIRGLKELERRAQTDMKVAFSMFPTAMDELLGIADAGAIMPPKSTWFEPKLRSGLFVHSLKD